MSGHENPDILVDRDAYRRLHADLGSARAATALALFAAEMRQRVPLLDDALAAADAEGIRRLMHSIKGSALTFGAPRLAAAALGAETLAQGGDAPAARLAALDVLALLPLTIAALDGLEGAT